MNEELGFHLRQDERGDWLYCEDGEDAVRYATLSERVLWKALLAAAPAAPAEPVAPQSPIAARKVAALIDQGWRPVGYVMHKVGERSAITVNSAVAWLTEQEMNLLLFCDGRVIEHPAAAPAAPAPADTKDAERYRWLREHGEPDEGMAYRHDWTPAMYDAAIDAAIAASK